MAMIMLSSTSSTAGPSAAGGDRIRRRSVRCARTVLRHARDMARRHAEAGMQAGHAR